MGYSSNVSEFINKALKIHGDKVDYSKFIYSSSKTKGMLVCKKDPEHGEFFQSPNTHLSGKGCPKCADIIRHRNLKKVETYSQQEVINKFINQHGLRYGYGRVKYQGCFELVDILCPIHGYFVQRPADHWKGQGCFKCGGKALLTLKTIKQQSMAINGPIIDFSKAQVINAHTEIILICKVCGYEFKQTPSNHIHGKQGCPKCQSSKGEKSLARHMVLHNVRFKHQYKFKDCKSIKALPFDFAVFNEDGSLRCLIEYQGEQHFKPIEWFGGSEGFRQQQKRDKIKQDYCAQNNIQLLTVVYDQDLNEFFEEAGALLWQ